MINQVIRLKSKLEKSLFATKTSMLSPFFELIEASLMPNCPFGVAHDCENILNHTLPSIGSTTLVSYICIRLENPVVPIPPIPNKTHGIGIPNDCVASLPAKNTTSLS